MIASVPLQSSLTSIKDRDVQQWICAARSEPPFLSIEARRSSTTAAVTMPGKDGPNRNRAPLSAAEPWC